MATKATAAAPAAERSPESAFLDGHAFDALADRLKTHDEQREVVIKRSRDIQKAAKQALFALHRGDAARAGELLAGAAKAVLELRPIVEAEPTLRHGGSFTSCLEEFAEARLFAAFLETGRLPPPAALAIQAGGGEEGGAGAAAAAAPPFELSADEYLGGLLDFTGELNRFAIARATERDSAAVARCRDCVDALMGRFLQFDLRNGSLRKKYDGLKYCLRNLEGTLYELRLAEATGRAMQAAAGLRGGAGGGGGEGEAGDGEGGGGGGGGGGGAGRN